MNKEWKIRHKKFIKSILIGENEASFPERTQDEKDISPPKYIKISTREEEKFLKTSQVKGAKGNDILVSPHILPELEENTTVVVTKISRSTFVFKNLWIDLNIRWAIGGLIIAFLGLLIDASLDIGKDYPLIYISSSTIFVLKIIEWSFKSVGLVIAFWRLAISKIK